MSKYLNIKQINFASFLSVISLNILYNKHKSNIPDLSLYRFYNRDFEISPNINISKTLNCFSLNNNKKIYTDLYIWGNGDVDNSTDYSTFHPHKIEKYFDINGKDISIKFNCIKHVEFGDYFTSVINDEGEVYTWISPYTEGKKNLYKKEEEEVNCNNNIRENIIKVSGNLKVKDVKFTHNKLFMLTESGDVYLYTLLIGKLNNKFYIKTNDRPDDINIDSNLIKVSEIRNIKQISTGKDHILMLTNEGDVYGMGDDSFGQLGLETYSEERYKQMKTYGNFIKRREKKPKKLNISNIDKIACGDNHSLLLDTNNNVYGMGYNRFLQLSNDKLYRQKYIGLNKPTIINLENAINNKESNSSNSGKDVGFSGLTAFRSNDNVSSYINNDISSQKFVDIVCSANCTFFITKQYISDSINKENTSYIYSAGEGLKGTLGVNYIKHMSDIEIVPDLSGLVNKLTNKPLEIKSFACGNQHCILLYKNPRMIFVWGNNEFGELGTKNREFLESPLPMLEEYTIPLKILNVYAGKKCSAFTCVKNDDFKVKELIKKDDDLINMQLKERKLKQLKNLDKKDVNKLETNTISNNIEKNKDLKDQSIFNIIKDTIKKYI